MDAGQFWLIFLWLVFLSPCFNHDDGENDDEDDGDDDNNEDDDDDERRKQFVKLFAGGDRVNQSRVEAIH